MSDTSALQQPHFQYRFQPFCQHLQCVFAAHVAEQMLFWLCSNMATFRCLLLAYIIIIIIMSVQARAVLQPAHEDKRATRQAWVRSCVQRLLPNARLFVRHVIWGKVLKELPEQSLLDVTLPQAPCFKQAAALSRDSHLTVDTNTHLAANRVYFINAVTSMRDEYMNTWLEKEFSRVNGSYFWYRHAKEQMNENCISITTFHPRRWS